jgi:hypothetical protein
LLAVVDGVGLQVVADVVHDEVCGNVAQLPAPTVSGQSVTKINSGKGLANYKNKVKEGLDALLVEIWADFVHPSSHPSCNMRSKPHTM